MSKELEKEACVSIVSSSSVLIKKAQALIPYSTLESQQVSTEH